MHRDKWNWWALLGDVLWLAAAASLALAWAAVWRKNLVLGLEPLAWYWNALVLGVLALGKKSHCGNLCAPEEKEEM